MIGQEKRPPYSYFIHRHNFAVWAAARASQRGFAPTALIKRALEVGQLPGAVRNDADWPTDEKIFDTFHRQHCRQLMKGLEDAGLQPVTYGRVAKMVAIYLKSMVVLGPLGSESFARLIHPPIDRILLQSIARDKCLPTEVRQACSGVNWTELSEEGYFRLIAGFRRHCLDKPAFWMLERYWNIAAE